MNLKSFILANLLMVFTQIMAQETTVAAGAEVPGVGGSNSFSIGQLFFTSDVNADEIISQGVQVAYINLWKGYVSNSWGMPDNWLLGNVPAAGDDIIFDLNPQNHLYLDQERTVNNITNTQSVFHTVLNGNRLNLKGALNFSNGALMNGCAVGSILSFSGTTAIQQLVTNHLYNQEIYNLDINNINNVSLAGTIKVLSTITSANGRLDATAFTPTIIFSGATAQALNEGVLLNEQVYNIVSDNATGMTVNTNLIVNNDVAVNSNRKMIVAPDKSLTVNGQLINSAGTVGLVLASSAEGTASIIHNTNNVPAIAQRYINGAGMAWHLLSTPVSGQAVHGSEWTPSGTYGDGTGYDMYVWDEPNSCWIYNRNTTVSPTWNSIHPQLSFVPGRGYLYALQEVTPTKQFVGLLNNGMISQNLTTLSTTSYQGFNLLGNPYPSSIDWKNDAGYDRSMLVNNGGGYDVWVWSNSANNYGVYNSSMSGNTGTNNVSRYIAPMVGFFVRANAAGSFNFYNQARVHTAASQWMKTKSLANSDKISVVVESEEFKGRDEVLLYLGSEHNRDGAIKLQSSVKSAPSLTLPSGKADLSIRYLSNTSENKIVPLGFKAGSDGKYRILLSLPDTIESAVLEDKEIGRFVELRNNELYSFISKNTDNKERFLLHFNSLEKVVDFDISVFVKNNMLIVDAERIHDFRIAVYDVTGKMLYNDSFLTGRYLQLPLSIKGVYVVTVETHENSKRIKVMY